MSLRQTTWKDYLDEWHENPWKAVAFIQKMLLDAEIKASDNLFWSQWEGMYLIQNAESMKKFNVDVSIKKETEK